MTDGISECLPGGVFVYHADEAEELITFNSEVMKIFGCDTAEEFRTLTGNSFKGMVHPDDLALVERNISSQNQKENDTDYIEYGLKLVQDIKMLNSQSVAVTAAEPGANDNTTIC